MKLPWWHYCAIHRRLVKANFYAKILDWNFRVVDENSQSLVVGFVSKLNFSFSFRVVDENCRIFVVVVVFVTKNNLLSSTKIFVFVVVDEKNTGYTPSNTWFLGSTRLSIPNCISISSAVFAQLKAEGPSILQWAAPFSLKIAHSHGGSDPPSNTWFLVSIRARNANGISIGSAVFAGLTTVTNHPSDRSTDHAIWSVTICHIHVCMSAMPPTIVITSGQSNLT